LLSETLTVCVAGGGRGNGDGARLDFANPKSRAAAARRAGRRLAGTACQCKITKSNCAGKTYTIVGTCASYACQIMGKPCSAATSVYCSNNHLFSPAPHVCAPPSTPKLNVPAPAPLLSGVPVPENPNSHPIVPPTGSPPTVTPPPKTKPSPSPKPTSCKWEGVYNLYLDVPPGAACKPNTALAYYGGSSALCSSREVFLRGPGQNKTTLVLWAVSATAAKPTTKLGTVRRKCASVVDSTLALSANSTNAVSLASPVGAHAWRIEPVSEGDCNTVRLVDAEQAAQQKPSHLSALPTAECTWEGGVFLASGGHAGAIQQWRLLKS